MELIKFIESYSNEGTSSDINMSEKIFKASQYLLNLFPNAQGIVLNVITDTNKATLRHSSHPDKEALSVNSFYARKENVDINDSIRGELHDQLDQKLSPSTYEKSGYDFEIDDYEKMARGIELIHDSDYVRPTYAQAELGYIRSMFPVVVPEYTTKINKVKFEENIAGVKIIKPIINDGDYTIKNGIDESDPNHKKIQEMLAKCDHLDLIGEPRLVEIGNGMYKCPICGKEGKYEDFNISSNS